MITTTRQRALLGAWCLALVTGVLWAVLLLLSPVRPVQGDLAPAPDPLLSNGQGWPFITGADGTVVHPEDLDR